MKNLSNNAAPPPPRNDAPLLSSLSLSLTDYALRLSASNGARIHEVLLLSLDNDTMHDTSSNQARITFTTAGTYFIHMHAVTAAANAEWALYMLEGDGPVWLSRDTRHITNSVAHCMQISTILTRTAASYISMQMWQNSGSSQDVAAWTGSGSYSMPRTYMMAFRIA